MMELNKREVRCRRIDPWVHLGIPYHPSQYRLPRHARVRRPTDISHARACIAFLPAILMALAIWHVLSRVIPDEQTNRKASRSRGVRFRGIGMASRSGDHQHPDVAEWHIPWTGHQ